MGASVGELSVILETSLATDFGQATPADLLNRLTSRCYKHFANATVSIVKEKTCVSSHCTENELTKSALISN